MWREPTVVTPATGSVIELSAIKARLRIVGDHEDAVLLEIRDEVIAEARSYTGLCLTRETMRLDCDGWADLRLLPVAPVLQDAAAVVHYRDAVGQIVALPGAAFRIGGKALDARIEPVPGAVWPAAYGLVRVEVDVGWPMLPYDVRSALMQRIADRFERRETAPVASFSDWDQLLVNYRFGGGAWTRDA